MFTRKMKIVLLLFVLFCLADNANATPRWRILDSGAIEWQIDGRLPHYDHIEMSGLIRKTLHECGSSRTEYRPDIAPKS